MERVLQKLNEETEYEISVRQGDVSGFGDYLLGKLVPITLKKERECIKGLLKVPTKHWELDILRNIMQFFFHREISVYTQLFNEFEQLQSKVEVKEESDLFNLIPCYYADDEAYDEIILLKDLSAEGYRAYKDDLFFDYNHASLIVSEIAKLHALSFVLQRKNPKVYNEFVNKLDTELDKHSEVWVRFGNGTLERHFKDNDNPELKDKLYAILESWLNQEDLTGSAKRVVIHNDIWNSNIIFKYENVRPVRACLVDYQHAQIHSPAYDLLFFFATSTDHDMRVKHFAEFTSTYHKTLEYTIRLHGIDPAGIYSMKELKADIKRLALYVLPRSLFGLQTWTNAGGMNADVESSERKNDFVCRSGKYGDIADALIKDLLSYAHS